MAKKKEKKKTTTRTKTSRHSLGPVFVEVKRTSKLSKKAPRKPAPTPRTGGGARMNSVTHTELASKDPEATRTWCESVLGWKFNRSVPTPDGPYFMWQTKMGTGGGIRANNPPEVPGSIPYVEVKDIKAAFNKAIDNGAVEMFGPNKLPGNAGWIAIVAAPGGVPIGFWAEK
jgi:uncharacterized protein